MSWFANHPYTRRRNQLQHLLTFIAVQSVSAPVKNTSMHSGVLFIIMHVVFECERHQQQPSGQLSKFSIYCVQPSNTTAGHFLVWAQWSWTPLLPHLILCSNTQELYPSMARLCLSSSNYFFQVNHAQILV